MYCESETSSWATTGDLYDRYGAEYIDKISTRTVYDEDIKSYVADETQEGRHRVQVLALCDAKEYIKRKLTCLFDNVTLLSEVSFPAIKQWHIKLTIETLKIGGDCSACACVADLDKFLECARICNDDGVCLPSKKTFFSMSEAKFICEGKGKCC